MLLRPTITAGVERTGSDLEELVAADLFCGAGGLTRAAQNLGLNVQVSIDNWDCALETHKENFEETKAQKLDLSDVEAAVSLLMESGISFVMGGPPCQDFSSAGKGIEGPRANLTTAFAQIISKAKPPIFLMENVPTAIRSLNFKKALKILRSSGYKISYTVLDAAYFGVPQHRKRLMVIGALNFNPQDIITELHDTETILPLSIREHWPDFPLDHYYRHPRSYSRRAVFSALEPSPTIRGVNRPRPKNYAPHQNDSTTSPVRALTSQERARLQSFPEEHAWIGSQSEIEQMIGNSIPPALGEHILKVLLAHHTGQNIEALTFQKWLKQEESTDDLTVKQTLAAIRRAHKVTPYLEAQLPEKRIRSLGESLDTIPELGKTMKRKYRTAFDLYQIYATEQSKKE